jgi:hypothetical protein
VFAGGFLALSKWHMRAINKYENIVVGHKLVKYVGKNPLDQQRDYHFSLQQRAMKFLRWKAGLLVLFTVVVICIWTVQFVSKPIFAVIYPDAFSCETEGVFVKFGDDFTEYRFGCKGSVLCFFSLSLGKTPNMFELTQMCFFSFLGQMSLRLRVPDFPRGDHQRHPEGRHGGMFPQKKRKNSKFALFLFPC